MPLPLLSRLLAAGLLTLALTAPGAAQTPHPGDRLAAAKALTCTFSTMAVGTWTNGAAVAEIKPATLAVGFDDIDADEGSARVIGAFGPADIIVRLSSGTLHFVQAFREGPLYATTIFPYEVRPGRLRAVHMRHEFTEISLPGFTSRPEQYYGDCAITR